MILNKLIKDYPNYTVDENGVVTNKHDRELKQSIDHFGRPVVTLINEKGRAVLKISRLVATAFVKNPKPLEYDVVMHNDDNPKNNHWSNLKWGTQGMNIRDAWNRGRMKNNRWGNKKAKKI